MENQFSQDLDYWIRKTKTFLHDPPDKAIHIPGHEERANRIISALGLSGSTLNHDEYHAADCIAAGMDRAALPGFVAGDDNRNGAVDFLEDPKITHPTGSDDALEITLPFADSDENRQVVESICREIEELVRNDIGTKTDGRGLSEKEGYRGNENNFAPARFHYLYFMLRRRLAGKDVGGLGGLWYRLPADTRMPDHSIWQHNGLVSAMASCRELSAGNRASLMVYALTPVQDFVGRARKLRDYWSGSVLLSWLAFEGIKAIIYRYGADHIIYPSLHGQPLVEGLLREWQMEDDWLDSGLEKSTVASFPNKFVCLVPQGEEKDAAEAIERAIEKAWRKLGDATLTFIEEKLGKKDRNIEKQFQRQLVSYWEHHWAAAPLIRGEEKEVVNELLHEDAYKNACEFWEDSLKLYESSGEGTLYSVTHRLSQAMLAAGKSRREERRQEEEGVKCAMFGEFEILHYEHGNDKNPRSTDDPFWQDMRRVFGEAEFGRTERLCALAVVKRLAHRVCRSFERHPLRAMFKNTDTFPSTTEMAMHDWWHNLQRKAKNQEGGEGAKALAENLADFRWPEKKEKIFQKLAQWYHEINEPETVKRSGRQITEIEDQERQAARRIITRLHKVQDIHKYYAVLMMDGDRMGRLINGETLDASWKTVLHPSLTKRLGRAGFEKKFKEFWGKWSAEKRLITPSVHAAISEALGDFSLHTVPALIQKYGGRLIYAGGDDVCAVLPVSGVLDAAREIAELYGKGFVLINPDGRVSPCSEWSGENTSKLAVHLGKGDDISISAGIMVAHHKKPLGKVMARAHELLDMAKNKGDRNGFALELDKRSGGGRIFMAKWAGAEEKSGLLHHFLAAADALQNTEQAAMSSSLAYRLNTFADGLIALSRQSPAQLAAFIGKQLDRSGLNADLSGEEKEKELARIAAHVAALIEKPDKESGTLPLETLIIANFIGHCRRQTMTDFAA